MRTACGTALIIIQAHALESRDWLKERPKMVSFFFCLVPPSMNVAWLESSRKSNALVLSRDRNKSSDLVPSSRRFNAPIYVLGIQNKTSSSSNTLYLTIQILSLYLHFLLKLPGLTLTLCILQALTGLTPSKSSSFSTSHLCRGTVNIAVSDPHSSSVSRSGTFIASRPWAVR